MSNSRSHLVQVSTGSIVWPLGAKACIGMQWDERDPLMGPSPRAKPTAGIAGPQNVCQDSPQAHAHRVRRRRHRSVHLLSTSKSTRKKFASWGLKARFWERSSPPRKKGGFRGTQFCTEVTRPKRAGGHFGKPR
jgi:hypothetical protein